jgi:hypothetical protein
MRRSAVFSVMAATALVFMNFVAAVDAQNAALSGSAPTRGNALVTSAPNAVGSLGTGYENSNGWCGGPYFNLTAAAGGAVTVTGFDMHFKGTLNRDVSVYWKAGTYIGSEVTPGAWTLLGTVNVTPVGGATSTAIALGGVVIPAGQTYGFKVWDGGTGQGDDGPGLAIRGGGTSASDTYLSLASDHYTCTEVFSGLLDNFGWQGTVHYSTGVIVPTMGIEFIVALFALLSVAAWFWLRRRQELGAQAGLAS